MAGAATERRACLAKLKERRGARDAPDGLPEGLPKLVELPGTAASWSVPQGVSAPPGPAPEAPGTEPSGRQAKLQALRAKRAARARSEEPAGARPQGGAAAPGPPQGGGSQEGAAGQSGGEECQGRSASIRAPLSARVRGAERSARRAHFAPDAPEVLEVQSPRHEARSTLPSEPAAAASLMKVAEAADAASIDDSATSISQSSSSGSSSSSSSNARRARIQALRSRSEERERSPRAALDPPAAQPPEVGRAPRPRPAEGEAPAASGAGREDGGRSAAQRRLDQIRLNRALREEDRRSLEQRDAAEGAAPGAAPPPRPPRAPAAARGGGGAAGEGRGPPAAAPGAPAAAAPQRRAAAARAASPAEASAPTPSCSSTAPAPRPREEGPPPSRAREGSLASGASELATAANAATLVEEKAASPSSKSSASTCKDPCRGPQDNSACPGASTPRADAAWPPDASTRPLSVPDPPVAESHAAAVSDEPLADEPSAEPSADAVADAEQSKLDMDRRDETDAHEDNLDSSLGCLSNAITPAEDGKGPDQAVDGMAAQEESTDVPRASVRDAAAEAEITPPSSEVLANASVSAEAVQSSALSAEAVQASAECAPDSAHVLRRVECLPVPEPAPNVPPVALSAEAQEASSRAILDVAAHREAADPLPEVAHDDSVPVAQSESEATALRRATIEQLKSKRAARLQDPDRSDVADLVRPASCDTSSASKNKEQVQNTSARRLRIDGVRSRRESPAADDVMESDDCRRDVGKNGNSLHLQTAEPAKAQPVMEACLGTTSAARSDDSLAREYIRSTRDQRTANDEGQDDSSAREASAVFWKEYQQQQKQEKRQKEQKQQDAQSQQNQWWQHRASSTTPEPRNHAPKMADLKPNADKHAQGIQELEASMYDYESDRAARVRRIQELRRARGADPMPELNLDLTPSAALEPLEAKVESAAITGPGSPKKVMDEVAGETSNWDDTEDEIVPSKKVVLLMVDSPDAAKADPDTCRPEPEPELQVDAERERTLALSAVAPPASSSAIVAVQQHVGLVPTREMVDDLKLRWQRYSKEETPKRRSQDCMSARGNDVLYEELQEKWRAIRGTSAADLRPDLQALVAPLDIQKVSLGPLQSPRCLKAGKTEPLPIGDAGIYGSAETPSKASSLPPCRQKTKTSLPPASPRWPAPSSQDLSPKTPAKVSGVVPLPTVALQNPGRQPLAGAATAAAFHGAEIPRERQQIDENCVHQ